MRAAEEKAFDRETSSECTLRVTVQDTGIGIPPEKQAIIFDSFTQVLGFHYLCLSLCKGIYISISVSPSLSSFPTIHCSRSRYLSPPSPVVWMRAEKKPFDRETS